MATPKHDESPFTTKEDLLKLEIKMLKSDTEIIEEMGRQFVSLSSNINEVESRLTSRFDSVDSRLTRIEDDIR